MKHANSWQLAGRSELRGTSEPARVPAPALLTPGQVNEELERERQAAEEAERQRREALEAQKAQLRRLEEQRLAAEEASKARAEAEEAAEAARRFQELQVGAGSAGLATPHRWQAQLTSAMSGRQPRVWFCVARQGGAPGLTAPRPRAHSAGRGPAPRGHAPPSSHLPKRAALEPAAGGSTPPH